MAARLRCDRDQREPEVVGRAPICWTGGMELDVIDHPGADPSALPASTVVLLRDGADELEVLMVHRGADTVFGGMWAFPGGVIEDADVPPDTAPEPLPAARRAAARETAEEIGLVLDPESMTWWSHWLPPIDSIGRKRFSTWFFAAPAPSGEIVIDDGEIKDHDWVSAATALDRHRAGEIEIVPPTWITLFQLAAHGSVDQAMAWARERTPRRFHTKPIAKDPITLAWEGDHAFDPSATPSESRHRLVMHRAGWEYIDTIGW